MGYPLKQSTTAYELLFYMVDSSDHISAKTGLSPTVTIRKAAGSFASPSGLVTEIANGWYKVAGNATDSNTLGPLVLHATGTGADPWDDMFFVIAYDPQDAVHLGLTALPNAAAEAAGGLYTRGSGAGQINQPANGRVDTNIVSAAGVAWASGAITSGVFAAGALDAVWSTAARTLTGFGTLVSDIWAFTTRRLTDGTNIVLAKGTGLTGLNDVSSSQVQTACASATVGLAVPGSAMTLTSGERAAVADAVWEEAIADHSGTSGSTAAALNAAGSAGDPWSTALPGSYGAGTAGKIIGDNVNAPISSRLASASYTAPPSANDNADALLDRTDGVESGRTLRKALRAILSSVAGKLSGAATPTVKTRDSNDSKDRLTVTTDSDGNRTAVSYDLD